MPPFARPDITPVTRSITLPAGGTVLHADLDLPMGRADGLVIFAHGSGSSRRSPRNRAVAAHLRTAPLATLLLDLLTEDEDAEEAAGGVLRFDVARLAERLVAALEWTRDEPSLRGTKAGLFGASTGAAAALVAAASKPTWVGAVVSRGGRPDLAGPALAAVRTPTLLIVGGDDPDVLELNRRAMEAMPAAVDLEVVPGASHLFEEPGALDEVARLARGFFARHLLPRWP